MRARNIALIAQQEDIDNQAASSGFSLESTFFLFYTGTVSDIFHSENVSDHRAGQENLNPIGQESNGAVFPLTFIIMDNGPKKRTGPPRDRDSLPDSNLLEREQAFSRNAFLPYNWIMQLSLKTRHIVIAILSWTISYCLVTLDQALVKTNKITPMGLAMVNLQQIKSLTINQINPKGIQNGDELQLLKSKIKDEVGLDPWGNIYQVAEVKPNAGEKHKVIFRSYSCGIDGTSLTGGNDRDDINSWDDHHLPHYRQKHKIDQRGNALMWSFVFSPFIFVSLVAIQRWVRKRQVQTG